MQRKIELISPDDEEIVKSAPKIDRAKNGVAHTQRYGLQGDLGFLKAFGLESGAIFFEIILTLRGQDENDAFGHLRKLAAHSIPDGDVGQNGHEHLGYLRAQAAAASCRRHEGAKSPAR